MKESTELHTELLVLPDGQILVHNLTPALAALLTELNPNDARMKQRAGKGAAVGTTTAEPPRKNP